MYQVNVVDGLKLFEELVDDSEVPKLVSLVNDLRAAGKRGQFQGKFTKCIFFYSHSKKKELFCFSLKLHLWSSDDSFVAIENLEICFTM